MGDFEFALIVEALRVLFILLVPLVLVVGVAGTLAGIFQAATTIQDPAIGYVARLLALVGVLYLLGPLALSSLTSLAQRAFG